MSGTYTNTDGKSDLLNQEAAHDPSLYDPDRHDNQIVAMYETNERAHAAQEMLVQAGVSSGAIQVIDQTTTAPATHPDEGGFWGAVRSLFIPDEDASAVGHALDHGHAMLVVHPTSAMDRSHVIHVLESTDPVDFDAKLEEWRQTGYDYSSHPMTGTAVGAAAGMATSAGVEPDVRFEQTDSPMETDSPFAEPGDAERRRVGRREATSNAPRVRSYLADRDQPQERIVESRAAGEEPVVSGAVHPGPSPTGDSMSNATPGAATSGANSPRT